MKTQATRPRRRRNERGFSPPVAAHFFGGVGNGHSGRNRRRLRDHGGAACWRQSSHRPPGQHHSDRRHPGRYHHDPWSNLGCALQPRRDTCVCRPRRDAVERGLSLYCRAMPGRHRRHRDRAPDVRFCAVRHWHHGAAQWFAESVATFTLIVTILGALRHAPQVVPWLVGLTITAAYWFTSSTSFANPAVTLARGFTTTFAGIAINHVPGFVAAQLAGAAAGAVVCAFLFPPPKAQIVRAMALEE